jgi:hypothetical protein
VAAHDLIRRTAPLVAVAAVLLAASCSSGGTSGAEDSARDLYHQGRSLNGLDDNLDQVSCSDSARPEPNGADITLYDCTLTFDEGGSEQWCVVDGSARTAPLPIPCSTIEEPYLTGRP